MRASRQDYGSGHFLPGREPFWNRAGLFDFDPWRRGPLATNGSRQDADRTAGTALPPREPWNFDIPAIDHGFRTVAACHPGDQAPRVRPKNCFRSPVSAVFRSIVITGPDDESFRYAGGHPTITYCRRSLRQLT